MDPLFETLLSAADSREALDKACVFIAQKIPGATVDITEHVEETLKSPESASSYVLENNPQEVLFHYWKYKVAIRMPKGSPIASELLPALFQMTAFFIFHHATIQYVSFRDALTGLYNQTFLKHILEQEVVKAVRYRVPVALLFIDVDDFKKVNDQHGHQEGSQVLKDLAQLLLTQGREPDLVFRYGGDEFLFLLPNTDTEGAKVFAERLRQTISRKILGSCQTHITVSIGVASAPEDGGDGRGIVHLADLAMYQAKKEGKDRIFPAHALPGSVRPNTL